MPLQYRVHRIGIAMNTVNQEPTEASIQQAKDWLTSRIVGQERLVERMLMTLICGGHLLVEGAPGLAKTHNTSSVILRLTNAQAATRRSTFHVMRKYSKSNSKNWQLYVLMISAGTTTTM